MAELQLGKQETVWFLLFASARKKIWKTGIFCLALGLLGCGGGETGQSGLSGTSGTSGTLPSGTSAVRAEVKSRCGGISESDFCSRAYAIIGQWLSGQITDEELVNRIVELRDAETPPATGDNGAGGETEPPEPFAGNPLEEECEREDPLDEVYDPAWEVELNFRERAVYKGIGRLSVGNPDGTHDTVAENIRIYSYNPGHRLSDYNTNRVLRKLTCRLVHNPDFHNVAVLRGRRVEDGTIPYTTFNVVGRPEGNVLLFFRDEEISSILESYDGLTYSQIRETAVTGQNYDYIAFSRLSHNEYGSFSHLTGYGYDDCRHRGRMLCIPGQGSIQSSAIGSQNDYYYDWLLIANEIGNRP